MRELIAAASSGLFILLSWIDDFIGLAPKVSESLAFRRSWQHYKNNSARSASSDRNLWIHGASVGELEDLASLFLDPVQLKKSGYSPDRVVITSSSVSARSRLKDWQERFGFRYCGPLPTERGRDVREFLNFIQPEQLLLSHSDFWPSLIHRALNEHLSKGIVWLPAKRRSARPVLRWLLPAPKVYLGTRFEEDPLFWQKFLNLPPSNVFFLGNPRIDRILQRIAQAQNRDEHILEKYQSIPDRSKLSILLGSAWLEDALFWSRALQDLSAAEQARLQIVVIPHMHEDMHQVASIQRWLPQARVLAMQGILLEAYRNFDVAYVGGGFKSGLHNILEPALWGLPLLCGHQTRQQPEAARLAQNHQLKILSEPAELTQLLKKLLHEDSALVQWKKDSQASSLWFANTRGATQRLVSFLEKVATL